MSQIRRIAQGNPTLPPVRRSLRFLLVEDRALRSLSSIAQLDLRRARWATTVMLMGAFVEETVKRTAEALRAHRVFDRPFEPALLLRAIQELSAQPS